MNSEYLIFSIVNCKNYLFSLPTFSKNHEFKILEIIPYSSVSITEFEFSEEFKNQILPFGLFFYNQDFIPVIDAFKIINNTSSSINPVSTSSIIIIKFKNNTYSIYVEKIYQLKKLETPDVNLKNKIIDSNIIKNSNFVKNCYFDQKLKIIELELLDVSKNNDYVKILNKIE
jgi:chemotaxis signal transduction protein